MNNYRRMFLILLSKFSEQYVRYSQREQLIITGALIVLCVGVFNFLVFEKINESKNHVDSTILGITKEISQLEKSLSILRSEKNIDPTDSIDPIDSLIQLIQSIQN